MIADQDKEKPVTPSLSAAHIVVKENHHRVKIAHSVRRGRIPSKTLQSDERGIGQHPGTVWGRMDVSDPLHGFSPQGLSDFVTLSYSLLLAPSSNHFRNSFRLTENSIICLLTIHNTHAHTPKNDCPCRLSSTFVHRHVTFLARSLKANFALTTSKQGALVSG